MRQACSPMRGATSPVRWPDPRSPARAARQSLRAAPTAPCGPRRQSSAGRARGARGPAPVQPCGPAPAEPCGPRRRSSAGLSVARTEKRYVSGIRCWGTNSGHARRHGSGHTRRGADPARHGSGHTRRGVDPARHGSGHTRRGADPARHGSGHTRRGADPARRGSGHTRRGASSPSRIWPHPPGVPVTDLATPAGRRCRDHVNGVAAATQCADSRRGEPRRPGAARQQE